MAQRSKVKAIGGKYIRISCDLEVKEVFNKTQNTQTSGEKLMDLITTKLFNKGHEEYS